MSVPSQSSLILNPVVFILYLTCHIMPVSRPHKYSSISLNFVLIENKAIGVMKPGHTFTIEPMISEGNLSVSHTAHHTAL